MSGHEIAMGVVMAVMLAGAAGTAFSRDVVRLVLSLGVFLLGVALAFLLLGSPLLAAAQVFVYVGGVLVLFLFGLMVVRRHDGEAPRAESRRDVGAAVLALGVFALLAGIVAPSFADEAATAAVTPAAIADVLLGSGIVVFELAGVLLLAALLAVLVIVKGGGER